MTRPALEPCPFCGSDEIIFKGPDGSPFSIICTNCCAEMPYMSLDDPQTERWNTRVTASGYAEMKRASVHLADEMDGLLPYLEMHHYRIDGFRDAVAAVRNIQQQQKA